MKPCEHSDAELVRMRAATASLPGHSTCPDCLTVIASIDAELASRDDARWTEIEQKRHAEFIRRARIP